MLNAPDEEVDQVRAIIREHFGKAADIKFNFVLTMPRVVRHMADRHQAPCSGYPPSVKRAV
jgi:hypothetical protein